MWDEAREMFITTKEKTLTLEHSLVSISKWEAALGIPFLAKTNKTRDELIEYIKCMTLTQNVDPEIYGCITNEHISQILKYIDAPMTATRINSPAQSKASRKIITSEEIYYLMITYGIPIEFQKWHLNRLFTLIRVCEIKNKKPRKMSRAEIYKHNTALNEARRRQHNTRG